MSQRSQVANSGSRPIAACSAACAAPGTSACDQPDLVEDVLRQRVPDGAGAQLARRQVERRLVDQLAGAQPAAQVADHLVGHVDRAERDGQRPVPAARRGGDDRDVGDVASRRRSTAGRRRAPGPRASSRSRSIDDVRTGPGAGRPRPRAPCRARRRRRPSRSASRSPASTTATGAAAGAADVGARAARGRSRTSRPGAAAARPRSTSCVERRADRRGAAAPDRSRRSPARARADGNSAAAQHSCGPSTYGFSGSKTLASTGRPNTASGWCTR